MPSPMAFEVDTYTQERIRRNIAANGAFPLELNEFKGEYWTLVENCTRVVGGYWEVSGERVSKLLEALEICAQYRAALVGGAVTIQSPLKDRLKEIESYGAHIERALQVIQDAKRVAIDMGLEHLIEESLPDAIQGGFTAPRLTARDITDAYFG